MKSSSLLVVFLPSLVLAHEAGHASSSAPEASDYVVKLSEMTAIEAGKGERIHLLNGREHGFESLSFILTETAPGGGPPLHTHESEEAHVLTSGTMSYIIGDQAFVVSAPYILRVPANMPHTFINAGTTPLSLTAVFGSADYTFKPLAPNPLQKDEGATP
jgi:mannose-6-phosphate isomerase-like protein (cupin superfamily)